MTLPNRGTKTSTQLTVAGSFFSSHFTHLTQVHVWEKQLVPGIVRPLVAGDSTVRPQQEYLPELTSASPEQVSQFPPSVAKAAEQFVATRGLTGRYGGFDRLKKNSSNFPRELDSRYAVVRFNVRNFLLNSFWVWRCQHSIACVVMDC